VGIIFILFSNNQTLTQPHLSSICLVQMIYKREEVQIQQITKYILTTSKQKAERKLNLQIIQKGNNEKV